MQQAAMALGMLGLCLLGVLGWIFGASRALDRLVPSEGADAALNRHRAARIRPWLFLAPALLLLGLYLVYPALATLWLSFHGPDGRIFVGMANHAWLLQDTEVWRAALNSALWLLVVPAAATGLGLAAAALTDRIWWGGVARALIFLPTAVSLVGAAVIWKFVYDYRPAGTAQIGLLNAVVAWAGGEPRAWLAMPFWNSFFLMAVLVWIQTGFAMMLLLAALRGIPEDTVEAAMLDGATGLRVFLDVELPQIRGAVAAVWVANALVVLKVFDIVIAMTNGQWNSNVLANLMFNWMFRGGGDFGRGAAVALLLMAMVAPFLARRLLKPRRDAGGA